MRRAPVPHPLATPSRSKSIAWHFHSRWRLLSDVSAAAPVPCSTNTVGASALVDRDALTQSITACRKIDPNARGSRCDKTHTLRTSTVAFDGVPYIKPL
jgi:hypothetical protein